MIPSSNYRTQNNPLVIKPGELRHSVVIAAPDYGSEDSRGKSAVPAAWITVRSTRAMIYTAGGREAAMASQIVSSVSHVVKLRWSPSVIKAGFRVLFSGRTMTVSYVENVLERNRVLLLYCQEIDGGGQ